MNYSLDPRKRYSISRVNCNNLDEIQKLHRMECRDEIKDFIVKPPHRPHPKPDPRPRPRPSPAPFRPEGVIPFDRKPLSLTFRLFVGYN